MARTTENFVMSLEALYWDYSPVHHPPGEGPVPGANVVSDVHVWPVFFKIDGATAQVPDSQGKLIGTATVSSTTGVGPVCRLSSGDWAAIPADIGHWSDQVVPIPLSPDLNLGPDVGGYFGVALLVIDPGGLESDALLAGHAALNNGLQNGLNDLITKLPPFPRNIDPTDLVKTLQDGIDHAIRGAMDFPDEVHVFFDPALSGSTFAYYNQDELPAAEFDQKDFDPTADDGPAPGEWGGGGRIGLKGAISRSRRSVGQGVLRQLTPQVRAVAGFTSPDGYQHAIAATYDGALTEMYWQGPGQVGSGFLTRFSSQIVGLAGYTSADGYQQVIVATDDGTITEVYWQGPNPPSQGALSHFDSRILAIAGYSAGDGCQHVIVAANDGDLTELWWLTGEVGRGTLAHLNSPVVNLARL